MVRNLILILMILFATPVSAAFDMHDFKNIPVAHDGRIKPLGFFATLTLQEISGEKISADLASQWLAATLFDPSSAEEQPLFLVTSPAVQKILGLTPHDPNYYKFSELNRAFVKNKTLILSLRDLESPTRDQQALLNLYANVTLFEQIKDSMIALLPLNGAAQTPFIELPSKHPLYAILKKRGIDNQFFRVIPVNNDWLSPWQVILSDDTKNPSLLKWKALAHAYISGDEDAWGKISATLNDPTLSIRLKIENIYHALNPHFISLIFYALAFISSILPFKRARPVASALLVGGLAMHGFGLLCRMIILMRPPVSTLYESILFVGFISVGIGFLLSRKFRDIPFLPVACVAGIALQLFGFYFADDQDNLRVLAAVLDTKFWLGTHVLVITAGYGVCLLTAALAHVILFSATFTKISRKKLQSIYSKTIFLAVVSLFLVAFGTILGGVWADQSWGRFWGWDPKENGALLIVLWLTWLLHGRLTTQIKPIMMMFGLAATSMIVAISWIGVNLLGVGLHSYGFVRGLGVGLSAFIALEISIFMLCYGLMRRRGSFHEIA